MMLPLRTFIHVTTFDFTQVIVLPHQHRHWWRTKHKPAKRAKRYVAAFSLAKRADFDILADNALLIQRPKYPQQ
jgi:hypothetical protein